MGVGGREVLEGLDFGGILLHEQSTIEGNLRLPDLTLCTVDNNTMLFGCLHQLQEVSVMLLGGMAIYTYIIFNDDYAWETVCFLFHLHLKDVLGHLQSKWHMQEPIPTMMHLEHGEV